LTDQRSGYGNDPPTLLSKHGDASSRLLWPSSGLNQPSLLGGLRVASFVNSLEEPDLLAQLPAFIKPLPSRLVPEDVKYLYTKGVLTLPSLPLQNALLKAYTEFVHPYMPLMDLHDFLNVVNARDGLFGQISLFLYQAVLFSATAFVDMKFLREAGFLSRRAARKSFFQKARVSFRIRIRGRGMPSIERVEGC
jgi:hypothetical protein